MIPGILQEYLDMLRAEARDHPYSLACGEHGVKKVNGEIDELLAKAASCCGFPDVELLKLLDFDRNDRDLDRIQSMFGVLRTILVLCTELSFARVEPLRRHSNRKEVDLLAVRQGIRFAVEVVRSNERTYRLPGSTKGDFYDYIVNVWAKKQDQIRVSMKTHHCEKGMLAVVLDSEPMKGGLMTPDKLSTHVKNAQAAIIWTNDVHLLVFTGEWYYGEGEPMTAISPELV